MVPGKTKPESVKLKCSSRMVPANGHYAKRIILVLEKTLVTIQNEDLQPGLEIALHSLSPLKTNLSSILVWAKFTSIPPYELFFTLIKNSFSLDKPST